MKNSDKKPQYDVHCMSCGRPTGSKSTTRGSTGFCGSEACRKAFYGDRDPKKKR